LNKQAWLHAITPAVVCAIRRQTFAGSHSPADIPARAHEWLRKPNAAPYLGGRSALDRMLAGQVADLFVVRQYLDAERGGKS